MTVVTSLGAGTGRGGKAERLIRWAGLQIKEGRKNWRIRGEEAESVARSLCAFGVWEILPGEERSEEEIVMIDAGETCRCARSTATYICINIPHFPKTFLCCHFFRRARNKICVSRNVDGPEKIARTLGAPRQCTAPIKRSILTRITNRPLCQSQKLLCWRYNSFTSQFMMLDDESTCIIRFKFVEQLDAMCTKSTL